MRQITRSYYKGAAGCLIVYDVTERETFEHVLSWLRDVREQADEQATIALVGNMADLPSTERSVSTEEGSALAQEQGYVHSTLTSACCFSRRAPRQGRYVTRTYRRM